MNMGMSKLWEATVLGWGTFCVCDCDLYTDLSMPLDFLNSMPYSPSSFFPYFYSLWARYYISAERYKGKEEMISVLTSSGGGRHVHQEHKWGSGPREFLNVLISVVLLSQPPKHLDSQLMRCCQRIWQKWMLRGQGFEICQRIVSVAISWYTHDDIMGGAVGLLGCHIKTLVLEQVWGCVGAKTHFVVWCAMCHSAVCHRVVMTAG